ncbi:hypothetical protein [Leptolyngbya sp. FACHB-711]|uniref:hypothetical protein n=1 Tax=unclassified Leptolyngbya TaxID=2650499 RepID=UPI001688A0AD|nr:hypothetical protein [Leptolyngbya sp. FACHB-711]MBD1853527.1 hypothetical protein [Cyanobacteria bacterium FACHB-502]MBD2027183.1 hypothetical protein [Leptolyngbya sp. FACHB-711]
MKFLPKAIDLTGEALMRNQHTQSVGELTTDLECLNRRNLSERCLYGRICLKGAGSYVSKGVKSFTEADFTLGLVPLESFLTLSLTLRGFDSLRLLLVTHYSAIVNARISMFNVFWKILSLGNGKGRKLQKGKISLE